MTNSYWPLIVMDTDPVHWQYRHTGLRRVLTSTGLVLLPATEFQCLVGVYLVTKLYRTCMLRTLCTHAPVVIDTASTSQVKES